MEPVASQRVRVLGRTLVADGRDDHGARLAEPDVAAAPVSGAPAGVVELEAVRRGAHQLLTHIPRISGIIDSMKRISVDLPDDLYERLRLAAFAERRSASAVVRDRLESSLPELPEGDGQK
jgi:hypothetical protein